MSKWWTFPGLVGLTKLPKSRASLRKEESLQQRPGADADISIDLRLREEPLYRLSEAEKRAWIDAVRNHKTADGSRVQDVLAYVRDIHPDKFKILQIDIVYHGSFNPSVGISFCPYPQWKSFDDCYELTIDFGITSDDRGRHVGMYEYEKILSHYSEFCEEITTYRALEKGRADFLKRIEYLHEWYRDLIE